MKATDQAVDYSSFVFASNDDIKTTSLLVAEKFGKRHADILRIIDGIKTQVSDLFYKRNFALTESETVLAASGGIRKDRAFELTKDGFMFLVMGFTGKAAAEIKEAYINAFNFMREKLFYKQSEKPFFKPQPHTTPLHPTMMTRVMKTHIQGVIDYAIHETNQTSNKVVMDLARHFYVDNWELIPMKYYPDVCAYFGEEPRYEVESTNNWVMIEESRLGAILAENQRYKDNALLSGDNKKATKLGLKNMPELNVDDDVKEVIREHIIKIADSLDTLAFHV